MPQQTARISPQLYARTRGVLYLYILVAASFAELSLALWLVVKGVDVRKWGES